MAGHNLTGAAWVTLGNAEFQPAMSESGNAGKRGVRMAHAHLKKFGAIVTADPDGVCDGATATAAATLSATGALADSDGVATFDVPRAVSLFATSNLSTVTITITGTDEYGQALVEDVAAPNTTTVNGKKAFSTITSVASDGAVATALDVGSANIFGLPVRLSDVGDFLSLRVDGADDVPTLVAGLSTTAAATATNGDVRGTVAPATAADGSKVFTILMNVADNQNTTGAYGIAQYSG